MDTKPTELTAASDREPWPSPEAAMLLGVVGTESGDRSPCETLADAVEAHVQAEGEALDGYRHLAETTPDPVVAMLMRLVLEDEERHHGLMARMAASLYDSLHWTHSPNALPVHVGGPPRENGAESIAAVRGFIREEQEGVRHLKALARESTRLHDGLDSLLLEIMAMDSQKHERILRYIEQRLTSS